MILDRLKVIIDADTSGYKKGLKEAKTATLDLQTTSDRAAQAINASFESIKVAPTLKAELETANVDLKEHERSYARIGAEIQKLEGRLATYQAKISLLSAEEDFTPTWSDNYQDLIDKEIKVVDMIETTKERLTQLNAQRDEEYQKIKSSALALAELKELLRLYNTEGKKSASVNKSFGEMLGHFLKYRIAYRLLRQLIGQIISSIKEGIQYLAVWDKKIGNIAGYNKTMSELATSFKKLGTQVSIVLAEVITFLAPVLQLIVNVLTPILNHLSALFAMLNGKTSYTVVNPDYWKDYADSVEESNSKLKETKKLISGFDELNVFLKMSSNSFTGDLVDTKELSEVGKSIASWIDEHDKLMDWIKAIASILGLLALLNSLFGKKNKLLRDQTAATENETEAVKVLNPAYALAAAAALGFVGVLGTLRDKLKDGISIPVWQPDLSPVYNALSEAQVAIDGFKETASLKLAEAFTNFGGVLDVFPAYCKSKLDEAVIVFPEFTTKLSEVVSSFPAEIGNAFESLITSVPSYVSRLSDAFRVFPETCKSLMTDVVSTFPAVLSQGQQVLAATGAQARVEVNNWLTDLKTQATNTIANVNNNFVNVINTTAATFQTKIQNARQQFVNFTTSVSTDWSTKLITFKTNFVNTTSSIILDFLNKLNNARNNLSTFVAATKLQIQDWATNTVRNISTATASWAANVYSSLQNASSNVANWVNNTSGNIASWTKNTTKSIADGANSMIKSIGSWVSSTATAIYSWAQKAISWIQSVAVAQGKSRSSISLQSIGNSISTTAKQVAAVAAAIGLAVGTAVLKPYSTGAYANGGVITSPTLALVGEYPGASNNPEIITPQNILKETIDSSNGMLAEVITQCTRQVIASLEDINMEVSIGDDVIAKSAARGNKSYQRMTGTSLF